MQSSLVHVATLLVLVCVQGVQADGSGRCFCDVMQWTDDDDGNPTEFTNGGCPYIYGNVYDNAYMHKWYRFQDKCYSYGYDKVSFYEARRRCAAKSKLYGVKLAMPKTQEINDFLMRAPLRPQDRYPKFWIGISDLGKEDRWLWADGTGFNWKTGGDWHNWRPGQPNDGGFWRQEDCAQVTNSAGEWNDNKCGSTAEYVCVTDAHDDLNVIKSRVSAYRAELSQRGRQCCMTSQPRPGSYGRR